MTDFSQDALRQTSDVATELAIKARETRARGGSRRDFFASTAKLAGATALGAAGIGVLQPIAARAASATAPTDTVQNIIDIAAIAEALATTFYYHSLQHPVDLKKVNSKANRNYFQAATVQEFEHLKFLEMHGAVKPQQKFYFPDNMFTDEMVFFATASLLEDYFISAYIAAAMEFSGAVSSGITMASPTLIGVAVQIAGIECEHRALLRVAANLNPPNNRIAETALLTSVGGAVGPLTPFLSGGTGFSGPYMMPNKAAIEATAAPVGFGHFPAPVYV